MGSVHIGVKIIKLRENETISSCSIEPSESEYEAKEQDLPQDEQTEKEDPALQELLKRASEENEKE